jgi:hypothetical protein
MKTKKLFLSQILCNCSKIQNQKDWIAHIDAILEVSREDVYRWLKSQPNKYVADFDYFFGQACEMFRETIVKPNLRKIIEIFKENNLENFAEFAVKRVGNLIVSLGTDPNYKRSAIGVFRANFNEGQSFQEEQVLKNLEIEDFLQKIDEDKIKAGLKKAWNDGVYDDFGDFEFRQLCAKFNFTAEQILGYNPDDLPEMELKTTKNGKKQASIIF